MINRIINTIKDAFVHTWNFIVDVTTQLGKMISYLASMAVMVYAVILIVQGHPVNALVHLVLGYILILINIRLNGGSLYD